MDESIFSDYLIEVDKSAFTADTIDYLVENGYAGIQMIDGIKHLRLFASFFFEGADLAKKFKRQYCVLMWNSFCARVNKKLDVEEMLILLSGIHSLTKEFTNGEVDFCEEIGEILIEKRINEGTRD